jgi:hypothetical protein
MRSIDRFLVEFSILRGKVMPIASTNCLPLTAMDSISEIRSCDSHIKNWPTLDPTNAINIPKSTYSGTQCTRILWTSATDATFARLTRFQPRSLKANQGQCQFQMYLLSLLPWTSLGYYQVTRNAHSFLVFSIT